MSPVLTVKEVLARSTKYLAERGSPSPRLDAEVLAAHALGVRRLDLYLAPERPLDAAEVATLREHVRRRGTGEPVAYITGRREFYGIEFEVTRDVLIPRPETEVLVDAVLDGLRGRDAPIVVDVGTGSGAIACSVAAHYSTARVLATDLSERALSVARTNAARVVPDGRVRLVRMDVMAALAPVPFADAIVSNPPYVSEDEPLDRGARDFEPAVALFCGDRGREVSARLIAQAPSRLKQGGLLAIEVGTLQHRDWVRDRLVGSEAWHEVRPLRDASGEVRGFLAVRHGDVGEAGG